MGLAKLVRRELAKHPLRSLLTLGSLVVALFLLCLLRSLVVTLGAGVQGAKSNRLVVQSAVSLFVELPLSYQPKIEALEGVERTCKWQWFGGYYQDPRNMFAQFAADQETLFDVYPDIELVAHENALDRSPEQQRKDFLAKRTSCIIGAGLADKFGWKVGDTIPLISSIFPAPEGGDRPWQFEVAGIYRPGSSSVDSSTMFFHWDYFQKTLESSLAGYTPGTGTIMLRTEPGADQQRIMAATEALFENGPQRVTVTTEAEFQAQFVSMVGNVPFFVGSIGGGVLLALLLACVNTMLMAGREQTRDVGILKALGFTDAAAFRLLIAQSLALCLVGGALGVALAKLSEPAMAGMLGTYFPNYRVDGRTMLLGLAAAAAIGLAAGIVPALAARRLSTVEALRAE